VSTLPSEIIRKKRDGMILSRDEMKSFIAAYLRGEVADYQMSAFLMAVYFRGMDEEETVAFTDVMLHSGSVVDLSAVPGIKVDKHSTGGVGDKASLILAPIVAACGVPVPMISGRGLGHTGGTLDKLESITGFRTSLSLKEYKEVLAATGCVMIGQTAEIAPADKKMYALRDVTGTVESIPLIAGSIMSKKLAEGIDALVLDVKTGRGAFMETIRRSRELALTLIKVGKRFGKTTTAIITDMSQPLGHAVGNWVEVAESIECLNGKEIPDLMEVTYALSALMLKSGGKASTIADGIILAKEAVVSGRALAKFREVVGRQGGNVSYVDHPHTYPVCTHTIQVKSPAGGFVGGCDALAIGFASILIGAGRATTDDLIDPKAGIILLKKTGDRVAKDETLATIMTDRAGAASEAQERVARAFTITPEAPKPPILIHEMIDEHGVHEW
jgi:pyrimidine-nucleoside phosphorylase